MRALGALALALLLASVASAHHTGSPVFTDPPGDAGPAGPWGDITDGWVDLEGDHLAFALGLAQLPAEPVGDTWVMTFTTGDGTMAVGAFQDPGAGLAFFVAPWDPATGPTGPIQMVEGTKEPGTPGALNISVPLAMLNLTAGSVLGKVGATTGVCFCVSGQGTPLDPPSTMQALDTAAGEDWRVPPNGTASSNTTGPPSPAPAAARTPGLDGAMVLALLAVAAVAVRRT